MEVRIVRSRRRTLSLEVRGETVLVRAPYGLPNTEIQRFLTEHQDWVAKARARQADRQARRQPLTGSEIQDLTRQAKAVIPERDALLCRKAGRDLRKDHHSLPEKPMGQLLFPGGFEL